MFKKLVEKRKVFLFLIILFITLPSIVFATYPLGDEVVLYEFENNVTNSGTGGATYDSALSGGAVYTSTAQVGEVAVSFAETNNYVDTKYGTGINPTTQSVSIAFWAYKTNSCTSGDDDHVFGASGPVANTRMYIRCKADGWQYRLGASAEVPSGVTAAINGWDHIVLVLDASDDTAYMYIDGAEAVTSVIPSYTIGRDFYVGHFNDGSTTLEGGGVIIDEVAIYDRALSPEEVETIYDESQFDIPGNISDFEVDAFDSGAYLTWGVPDEIGGQIITDYKIEYKENSSGSWSTFSDDVSTSTYATVTGLDNGTLYDFRISAVNASGDGSSSDQISTTPNTIVLWNDSTTANAIFSTSTLNIDYSASSTFPYAITIGFELRNASTSAIVETASTTSPTGIYDLNNLTTINDDINLTLGTDTSAITYADVTGTFFTIHNGNGSIDEITRAGDVIRTITCSGCGDVEGIEWISAVADELGQYTHTFMTSYEGVGSSIRLTEIAPDATSYSPGSMYNLGFGDLANLGLEGVAYDPDNDLYYVVKEKTPVALYEVDLNGSPDVVQICDGQLGGISDLSDVDFSNGELFLLSHESDNVTRVTLNPCTVTADTLSLGMTQAEGITWDTLGRNLYIAGEPDQFSRFKTSDVSFTSSFSTTVADGTYEMIAFITDRDGNRATSSARTYVVDTTPPTPVITTNEDDPTETTPIPISIDFGEDVTGFVVGDITVGNGTAGNFAGGPRIYTADITPTALGEVTVDISTEVATDTADLFNEAATQFSITYGIEEEESNSSSGSRIVGRTRKSLSSAIMPVTNPDITSSNFYINISEITLFLQLLGIEIPKNLSELINSENALSQPSTCPVFTEYYKLGDSGSEVRNIQLFLNKIVGSDLPGTTLYGPLTVQAVKQFQQKESASILTPWGLTNPTGWWYQTTQKKANELSGC